MTSQSGINQYEEKYRDYKIDADLLPRLTVDDLKDIGISVVGDRRRLLDVIALIGGAGRPADLPASPTKSAPSKGLHALAERRPITVMFCDLVGFHKSGRKARPRRLAEPRQHLSRRSVGSGDRACLTGANATVKDNADRKLIVATPRECETAKAVAGKKIRTAARPVAVQVGPPTPFPCRA